MPKYQKLWMTGPSTAVHDVCKDEQSDPAIKLFGRVILQSASGGSPKCQSPETGLTETNVSGPANVRGIYDGISTGTTIGTEFRLDMEAKSMMKASRPYTPVRCRFLQPSRRPQNVNIYRLLSESRQYVHFQFFFIALFVLAVEIRGEVIAVASIIFI